MRILASSDIHMGRIPSVDYKGLTSSSSFFAVVETAIKYNVEVLLLAGDIVDSNQYWYEAYGPLSTQIDKLNEHNIKVIAVSGNHDSTILSKLANEKKEKLKVLGSSGQWEAFEYGGVKFIGWSFTSSSFVDDPFEIFNKSLLDNPKPTIGLIHCDVNAKVGSSSYAPVSSSRFDSYPEVLWITGHSHIPIHSSNYINCGSPYPLDSSEKGSKKVWLLESNNLEWKSTPISISPYHFENCNITLDSKTTESNLEENLVSHLKDLGRDLVNQGYKGIVYCDLLFEGVINSKLDLKKSLSKEKIEEFYVPVDRELKLRVLQNFRDKTTLELNLEQLAQGVGPKSILSQILIDLDENSVLLEKVAAISKESFNKPTYSPLVQFDKPLSIESQKDLLKLAANRLLSTMVNQGTPNE